MELIRDGAVLTLLGPLDARCTAQVRVALYDHLAACEAHAVLDLSEVPWVDLAALNMLGVATVHAEREGRHLTLRGCSPHLRRVLQASRLRSLLEVERDTETA